MNGPIAQFVALTCHANAFLRGQRIPGSSRTTRRANSATGSDSSTPQKRCLGKSGRLKWQLPQTDGLSASRPTMFRRFDFPALPSTTQGFPIGCPPRLWVVVERGP